MAGRLRTGHERLRVPGLVAALLPAGYCAAPDLLRHYGSRLATVELNNTFYRQPSPAAVDGWLAATPPTSGSRSRPSAARRSGRSRSTRATASPWLTAPLRRFGERLGTVLFRVPDGVARDDERLAGLLAAWPADLPLAMEFQDRAGTSTRCSPRSGRPARRSSRRICDDGPGAADDPPDRPVPLPPPAPPGLHAGRARPVARPARAVPRRRPRRLRLLPPRRRRAGRRAGAGARGPRARGVGRRAGARAGDASAGARPLGRSERDEQRQVLGDVVEAVRDGGRDEHDRARPDVADLVADGDPAAARDT